MPNIKNKISINNLLIDAIETSSNDDWNELCNACSSLIKDSKMTENEIDEIVNKVKRENI